MHTSVASQSGAFKPTRWTLVLRAVEERSPAANSALDELCRAYWYPLFCFARRRGLTVADAEDATQGFFARILQTEMFANADPAKGRLRTFLLTAFQRYLIDFDKHRFALKRGGSSESLSLDAEEERDRLDVADHQTPEKLFEQQWALAVLANTLSALDREWEAQGRADWFSALRQFLSFDPEECPESYQTVASRLNISAGAARLSVFRLRRRFREVLYTHIADTLTEPSAAAVEEEIRALYAALS
jgi:DNA-directed RNA polymerase specialized sigma24 family protein